MGNILKNEFIEIKYSAKNKLMYKIWSSSSSYMSESDFREQIELFFGFVEVNKPKIAYIDAYEFCYYINEKAIQLIRQYVAKCRTILFGFVVSSALLGKAYIKRLEKEIHPENLKLFRNRKEGELWLSSNFNISNYDY